MHRVRMLLEYHAVVEALTNNQQQLVIPYTKREQNIKQQQTPWSALTIIQLTNRQAEKYKIDNNKHYKKQSTREEKRRRIEQTEVRFLCHENT